MKTNSMFGDISFKVKAVLDTDGNPQVSVTAVQPYGPDGRSVNPSVEITDKKALDAIGKELKAAIVDVREDLIETAYEQAAESYANSAKRGEFKRSKTASK